MKNKLLFLIIIFNTFLSCTFENKKEKKVEFSQDFYLDTVNEKLKKFPYPLEGGFDYKDTELDKKKIENWFQKVNPILVEAFKKLSGKYILVIKGHADPTGPEFVTEDKKGNMFYSTIRAENTKNFLIQRNFPKQRMKSFGVGSIETVDKKTKNNPKNRRVTLMFVNEDTSSIF